MLHFIFFFFFLKRSKLAAFQKRLVLLVFKSAFRVNIHDLHKKLLKSADSIQTPLKCVVGTLSPKCTFTVRLDRAGAAGGGGRRAVDQGHVAEGQRAAPHGYVEGAELT